jgi:hypothetical protein
MKGRPKLARGPTGSLALTSILKMKEIIMDSVGPTNYVSTGISPTIPTSSDSSNSASSPIQTQTTSSSPRDDFKKYRLMRQSLTEMITDTNNLCDQSIKRKTQSFRNLNDLLKRTSLTPNEPPTLTSSTSTALLPPAEKFLPPVPTSAVPAKSKPQDHSKIHVFIKGWKAKDALKAAQLQPSADKEGTNVSIQQIEDSETY